MTYIPYPRSLYRLEESADPDFHFDGVKCAMITVESEEEETQARINGWHGSPAEAAVAEMASDIAKFDHDGDGKPGGSKPRKRRK